MSEGHPERQAWAVARARWKAAVERAAACLAPARVMTEVVDVDPDQVLAVRRAQRRWDGERETWARAHADEDVEGIRAAAVAELEAATAAFHSSVEAYRSVLDAAGQAVPEDFRRDVYEVLVAPALAADRRRPRWSRLPDARRTIEELRGGPDLGPPGPPGT